MSGELPRVFEALHTRITVSRLRAGLVVVRIEGNDIGELHDAPFQLLDRILEADGAIDLFIDAREGRTASMHVSNDWALWLRANKARLRTVRMLAVSQFIHLTAEHVRRFAELGDQMRVFRDPAAFDRELANVAG